MKTIKKFFTLMLALVMVLTSFTITAYADTTKPSNILMEISNYNNSSDYGFKTNNSLRNGTNKISAKKGEKITISFVLSGTDTLYGYELYGTWNTNYLTPGYYNSRNAWIDASAKDDSNVIIENVKDINGSEWIDGYSFVKGSNKVYLSGFAASLDTQTVATSQSTVYDPHGMVLDTIGFNVLSDIDNIYDVFTWNTTTTMVMPNKDTEHKLKDGQLTISCNHAANTNIDNCTKDLYCSVCGALISKAKGHDYKDVVTAPTCTEDGYTTHTCTKCNDSYIDSTVAATGHKWDDGVLTTSPTCNGAGVKTYTCTVCNATKIEATSASGHTPGDWETVVPSTCTSVGKKVKKCTVCNAIVEEGVIEKSEHTAVIDKAIPATCTSTGLTEGSHCSVCNTVIKAQKVIPVQAHDYKITQTKPTCTEPGRNIYTCKDCGYSYTGEASVSALGHNWNSGVVTKAATCTSNGVMTYTCNRCNDTRTEAISATGHTVVIDKAVPATSTSTGLTEGSHCSVCKTVIKAQKVVPIQSSNPDPIPTPAPTEPDLCAKGHQYTSSTKTLKATENFNGNTMVTYTCKVCGYKYSKTTKTIARISSIKLSARTYTYNGKTKTPSVVIKDSNGATLRKNVDYTVSYAKGRKNIGKYAVKITFKGNYSGTKTLYFYITPLATTIKKVRAKKKGFKVIWKKQKTQISGYQIQYSTSSSFKNAKTITITNKKSTSKTKSKLKAKKKYYVRVRTYRTVSAGKGRRSIKIYSNWSKTKSVTTKK